MSTDITHYQGEAVLDARGDAQTELVRWAEAAVAAHNLATSLAQTTFVPQHLRGNPGDCTAAILLGAEVGLTPINAVQALFVIGGKPAMYARTMVALVQGAGHEVWTEDDSPDRVTVVGQRKGSTREHRVTWTLDRARQAGYTSNKKYQTDPQAMLWARAASDVCRRMAPDVLMGIAGSVEELDDTPGEPVKVSRATARAAKPEPPAPAAPEPITDAQSKKLHALTGDLELDRDAKLAFCARVLGREVATTGDLTKGEARSVIDALEAEARDLNAEYVEGGGEPGPGPVAPKTLEAIKHHADRAGWSRETILAQATRVAGRDITAATDLTSPEAQALLEHVASQPDADSGAEKVKAAVRAAREEGS